MAGWTALALLVIAPLVAMQFTSEVHWTGGDFLFAAVLFGLVGLGLELAARHSGGKPYVWASGLAIMAAFLTVWINLAVGIIGNEDNPMNLMFFGVLAVALGGAIIARFRAAGMRKAMYAAGIAQIAVFAAAAFMGALIPVVTLFFTALWLAAAALYGKARRP